MYILSRVNCFNYLEYNIQMNLFVLLSKLDIRISGKAYSRPRYQVLLLANKLSSISKIKVNNLLDIGGGSPPQYKSILMSLTKKYTNLEIKKTQLVDIVGSVYDIPLRDKCTDIETLFMVMEHLNEPKNALIECNRVLKHKGYLLLTTVQYWHTHNHPSDYLRYTKAGLEYYCFAAGFKVVDIWSIGGPFLVVFHAIELNLPDALRTIYSIIFYRLFDWLDWLVFKHNDTRKHSDSVGWSLIAQKI